ncbi:MAG: CehA/McbA family metallohydrolase [Bryobacterales bacterium]|nr:CehA/McbA family metallohydrolase [Bryobacterales bacterium]
MPDTNDAVKAAWTFRAATLAACGVLSAAWLAWSGWAQGQRDADWSPLLELSIVDAETGAPIAARFSVVVDGSPHEPRWVGPHGYRFVSVHVSKRQTEVALYARGTGPVIVPLTPQARRATVAVVKGLDYLPVTVEAPVTGESIRVTARLQRWNRLREKGWRAADAHLHYDRLEPSGDRDWFAMMAGDDISHGQFMTLKGGMVPGVWAHQFALGDRGQATVAGRTIVAGQEYRDRLQGHVLLFGLGEIIQPIMAGVPDDPHNFPTLADVMRRARASGGMAGIAHGGNLGGNPTAIADVVLGTVEFMEIANWGWEFWPLENWYQLLSAGFILPVTAGTDLPNNPRREPWQPFLGGMRTYVRTRGTGGPLPWNASVRRGETFVTSGPVLEIEANGAGPGGTVCLPSQGGGVSVTATMRSPRALGRLEIVKDGTVDTVADISRQRDGVWQIDLQAQVRFRRSGWIAVRGSGADGDLLGRSAVAHSSAIRVIVGGKPIWSEAVAASLTAELQGLRDYYRRNGKYRTERDRREVWETFDRAIGMLAAPSSGGDATEGSPCAEN